MSSSSPSGQPKKVLCTDEEVLAAFKVFKFICQLCNKPGHSAHKCFKRFNVDFRPTPLKSETKTVQQAMSALQIDTVGISHWLLDSGVSSHMTQP